MTNTVENLFNKALSTESEGEAASCLNLIRKKHKGKKVKDLISPSPSSPRTRLSSLSKDDINTLFKNLKLSSFNIWEWKELAERYFDLYKHYKERAERSERLLKEERQRGCSLLYILAGVCLFTVGFLLGGIVL